METELAHIGYAILALWILGAVFTFLPRKKGKK